MIINNLIGEIHVYTAILATIFGTYIIASTKGTKTHKQIGMIYAVMMLIVNITAFMIYRLYGGFGIFHGAAAFSLFTLLAGMVPIMIKRNKKNIIAHICYMYWSVIGLYAAFVAETLTRIPNKPFYTMLILSVSVTFVMGNISFRRYKNQWIQTFTN